MSRHPGEYFARLAEIEFAGNFAERADIGERERHRMAETSIAFGDVTSPETNQRVLISLRPNYTERMQSKPGIAIPLPLPLPSLPGPSSLFADIEAAGIATLSARVGAVCATITLTELS